MLVFVAVLRVVLRVRLVEDAAENAAAERSCWFCRYKAGATAASSCFSNNINNSRLGRACDEQVAHYQGR